LTDIIGETQVIVNRKDMIHLSFRDIRFMNSHNLFGPAEKNGDRRLSFSGYYYL
jgi:hypothetical protein